LSGACFLLRGVQIEPNEMFNSAEFGMGCNMIAFVNALLYFNLEDLAYQSQYPLSIIGKNSGLLGEGAMATAINIAVGRGDVVEVVGEVEEQLSPAYKHYCVKGGNAVQFFQWSLYMAHMGGGVAAMDYGSHFEVEVLLEIETIRWSDKAAKNQLMKNQEWGGKMVFTYWPNYSLVWMIKITSSKAYVLQSGGDLSKFVRVKILVWVVRLILDGLLVGQGPNNIIRRGQVGALRDDFGMDLQLTIQRMKQVMNFCLTRSKRDAVFPRVIDFGFLNQAWVTASQMLGVLLMPVDWSVNSNDRTCPWCLGPILSWIFGIFLCGHLMHMKC
jgi:hypothetical protein